MTEKQASAWVNTNCRFAAMESIKDMVRTSSHKVGVELTSQEADFYSVKAVVCASLVTAALSVEDVLRDYYGVGADEFNKVIRDSVAQSKTREDAVNNVIELLQNKSKALQSRVSPSQKSPLPTINWGSPQTRSMIQGKVLQYLKQTDPASLYVARGEQEGFSVGPHAGQEERARLGQPPVSGVRPAPMTTPVPYKPIPRKPGKPLPNPAQTRQPIIPPSRGPVPSLG